MLNLFCRSCYNIVKTWRCPRGCCAVGSEVTPTGIRTQTEESNFLFIPFSVLSAVTRKTILLWGHESFIALTFANIHFEPRGTWSHAQTRIWESNSNQERPCCSLPSCSVSLLLGKSNHLYIRKVSISSLKEPPTGKSKISSQGSLHPVGICLSPGA